MDTTDNKTVEVYDNLTGKHYTRDCTPEEILLYEELAKEQNETITSNADALPDAG